MSGDDLGRLLRTVRHLPPQQVVHRLRLRAQKAAYGVAPKLAQRVFDATAGDAPGWPASFRPLDAETEAVARPSLVDNLQGRFELLDVVHELGRPIEWQPGEATQLWRYHLHYFDWAWVLWRDPSPGSVRAFGELYRSWRDSNPVGRWDAWSPYVVALRSWTLCSVASILAGDEELTAEVHDDLVRHARYLRRNVEFDVGGNHLIKDLKALVGLGVFLGDDELLRFAGRHLLGQLSVQVLADGGHFERSPGYHAQALGDLIDVHGLLGSAGLLPGLVAPLADAIDRMQSWLSSLLRPDGSLPVLNDSVPVSEARLEVLGVREPRSGRLTHLQPSGYAVIRPRAGVMVVMDVGPPCPVELPAHAQADALGIVVQVGGRDVLIDTGTSTYAAGPRRQYERSTRAHNTVEIDGEDQTEVWGAFRAGRRHHVTVHRAEADDDVTVIDASHDGYRHLAGSPVHRRVVTVTPDAVEVVDRVTGTGRHEIAVHWHLAPGAHWEEVAASAELAGARLELDVPPAASFEFVPAGDEPLGVAARGHNVVYGAPCLVVRLPAIELPVQLRATVRF